MFLFFFLVVHIAMAAGQVHLVASMRTLERRFGKPDPSLSLLRVNFAKLPNH